MQLQHINDKSRLVGLVNSFIKNELPPLHWKLGQGVITESFMSNMKVKLQDLMNKILFMSILVIQIISNNQEK